MTVFNYYVNYIDLSLAALLLIFAISGYARGLFIGILNFIRASVGIFLCFFLSEKYHVSLYESVVKPKAVEYINEKITTSNNLDTVLNNLNKAVDDLPFFMRDMINAKTVKIQSGDITQAILENVLEPALLILTKAAIFIAVFVVFFTLTAVVISLIKRRSKKKEQKGKRSPLKKADKFLGLLFGILKGALVLFAATSILLIMLEAYKENGNITPFFKEVEGSTIISLIDKINPFNAITEGII